MTDDLNFKKNVYIFFSFIEAGACIAAGGSGDLLLDEEQVLGELQAVLLHQRLQLVVLHQVVEHLHRGLLVLQRRRTSAGDCELAQTATPSFHNESFSC